MMKRPAKPGEQQWSRKEHPVFSDEVTSANKHGFSEMAHDRSLAWDKPGFRVERCNVPRGEDGHKNARKYYAYKQAVNEDGTPMDGVLTSIHKVAGANGEMLPQEYASAEEAMADCV